MPKLKASSPAAALIGGLLLASATLSVASAASPSTPPVTVGPQYDTTHVYVAPEDFDRIVASFVAPFGGTPSKRGVLTLIPMPSQTMSPLVLTPLGTSSLFVFN